MEDRPSEPALRLAPRHDLQALQQALRQHGRVRVPGLLADEDARRLHQTLDQWRTWALVTRIEGVHRSFDAAAMNDIDPARRAAFFGLVERERQRGFQYLFERYPLVDHGRDGRLLDPVLRAAFQLLRSEAFLDLGRRLLAAPEIRFTDGQLTRYRAGHFLTLHDDDAEGLHRVAAYVLNLSPGWPEQDGGALVFPARGGDADETWLPGFNTLSLFRVPAPHWVAPVAATARGARLSITGWFRFGDEPPLVITA